MEAPHVVELDRIAAEEIGQLVALVEAIDLDIAERGLRSRRSLLELRLRASGRLEKWLPSSGGRRSHAPTGPQRLRKVGSRPRSLDGVLERTMTEDVRAVLEAIAFGDDGRVTPSDRLRALEHLSRMEPGEHPEGSYSSELAALEGDELDRHLDALLAEQIAADVFGLAKRWPRGADDALCNNTSAGTASILEVRARAAQRLLLTPQWKRPSKRRTPHA